MLRTLRRHLLSAWLAMIGIGVLASSGGPSAGLAQPHPFPTTHTTAVDAVGAHPAGGVIVAGTQTITELVDGVVRHDSHGFLRALDADGVERWHSRFDTGDAVAVLHAIALDDEGRIYLVGHDNDYSTTGYWHAMLWAFEADGTPRWSRRLDTPSATVAFDVAVDRAGRVYVVGDVTGALPGQVAAGTGEGEDAFVRAYDDDGAELWTRQFGTADDDAALGVAVDREGQLYVVGASSFTSPQSGVPSRIWPLLRVFDREGRWIGGPEFPDGASGWLTDVAVDAAGNVLVVGVVLTGDEDDAAAPGYLRAFDARRQARWTRRFPLANPQNLRIATDGGRRVYVLAGGAYSADGQEVNALRAFDGDGNDRWVNETAVGTEWRAEVTGLAADDEGRTYVVGTTYPAFVPQGPEVFIGSFVRAHDPDGTPLWSMPIGASDDDSPPRTVPRDRLTEAGVSPIALLARHMAGDWGDLDADDRRANDRAVRDGDRVLSAYEMGAGRVWLITEWDRSATTLLLPEE